MKMVSMTSFEILPPPDNNSDAQDAQSPDFVVYSNPSSPQGAAGGGSISPRSVQSIISSLIDSRAEEMQKKVSDLLQENNILKDKVKKSNIVMLEQLNTISSWGKEISEFKRKQAELLEDKQKSYEKIQHENEELKAKIKEFEALKKEATNMCEQQHAKEVQTSQTFCEGMQNSELEDVIRHLTKEVDELQSKNKVLEEETKDLRAFNTCLVAEIEKQKSPAAENGKSFATVFNDDESGYAIVFKEEEPCFSSNDSTKMVIRELHDLQLKYSKICDELEKKEAKIADLGEQLGKRNEQVSMSSEKIGKKKRKGSSGSTNEKCFEELAYALCAKSDQADIYQKRSEELEKELEELKSKLAATSAETVVVADLKAKIASLEESLKQEESTNESLKESLSKLEADFKNVSEMHEKLTKLLDDQEERQRMKSEQLNTMKDISDRYHIEQLDILTAKLFNIEQLLDAEHEKTQNLQVELDQMKDQSEEISVLKEQLAVFQADFEDERQALERAKTEIARLVKEKEALEKELQEAKDSHSHRSHVLRRFHHNDHRRRRGRHSVELVGNGSEEEESNSKEVTMTCPQCKMIFRDDESLQSHMELCLNDDIFLV